MFKRIVLGTDGSEDAMRAAEAAAELAAKFNSQVTIVSVYSPVIVTDYGMSGYMMQDENIESVQTAVTERTSKPFKERGVEYDVCHEVGNPAQEILRVAGDQKANLVVLGSRGLGGIKAFLLGSVSDRVAHHAHCPVLIVRD